MSNKDLILLGFSFVALIFSTYNFIRSLIDTKMKYELDYLTRRFGIDHDLATFEARVFRKNGEAQQLRRDGMRAGVQEVVNVAEDIEKNYLGGELIRLNEIRSQLKNIPESYAGRKFIVSLDTLRNKLNNGQSEVYEAQMDNLIQSARRLLDVRQRLNAASAQQLVGPERRQPVSEDE